MFSVFCLHAYAEINLIFIVSSAGFPPLRCFVCVVPQTCVSIMGFLPEDERITKSFPALKVMVLPPGCPQLCPQLANDQRLFRPQSYGVAPRWGASGARPQRMFGVAAGIILFLLGRPCLCFVNTPPTF